MYRLFVYIVLFIAKKWGEGSSHSFQCGGYSYYLSFITLIWGNDSGCDGKPYAYIQVGNIFALFAEEGKLTVDQYVFM